MGVSLGSEAGSAGVEYHPPHEAKSARAVGAAVELRAGGDLPGLVANVAPSPPVQEAEGRPGVGLRVVGTRIDWLTFAFKVELSPVIMGELYDLVEDQARAAFTFAGCEWEVRKMRTGQRLLLRNADVAMVLDPQGPEEWTVQVDFTGAVMMRTDVDRAVEVARAVAAMLGKVKGQRVRRLDLCADVAGLDVAEVPADAFVKPSRARLERASVAALEKGFEHPDLKVRYRSDATVTGFTVCPGNVLSCVVYDKVEELRQQERPDKREAEMATWRAHGWSGDEPVTRVEFRLRSEVLHELGARDGLDAFRAKLDAIWGYCARAWLRLVVPGTADRPSRCDVAPAWSVVRAVRFVHPDAPSERRRIRSGATAAQAFGAALSHVACEGKEPPPFEYVDERTGEVLRAGQALGMLDDDAVATTLTARVDGIFAAAAREVAADMVQRFGLRKALEFVLVREGAARARFSSADAIASEYGRKAAA